MYLYKNVCFSFIINSRIIIHISEQRTWQPLQENKAIFLKYTHFKIFDSILEKLCSCLLFLCYWRWKDILRLRWKGLMSFTRKLNIISEKKDFEHFKQHFKKKWHFAYSSYVIDGKIRWKRLTFSAY